MEGSIRSVNGLRRADKVQAVCGICGLRGFVVRRRVWVGSHGRKKEEAKIFLWWRE